MRWILNELLTDRLSQTSTAIYAFFLAMLLHPHVALKAQAEIDAIVGNERLPTYNDRAELPYVDALMKEVFRWHTIAPIGVAHRLMEDDTYNGYLIPKGSLIYPNIWYVLCCYGRARADSSDRRKITHDPDHYKDPMSFNPDRFMGDTPEPDPRDFMFGFGRR